MSVVKIGEVDGDKQDETGRGGGEDDSNLGVRDERSDEAEEDATQRQVPGRRRDKMIGV